jgi:hypothetical protein
MFFIEATGPDAYTIGDTTYRKLGISDDWTLGASAADNDGDGKDEVYVTGYYDGSLFVITDSDGDATSLDQTGGPGDWTGNSEIAIIHEFGGGGGFGTSTVGDGGVIHGGPAGVSDINLFELADGGNPLDSSSWTHSSYALDDATSGWAFKAKAWFIGDAHFGVLLPYQAVNDTLESGELDPAGNRVFRLAEYDGSVTVRDITFIMPEDYKLAQNFPNPFNATTRIEYSLPLQNTISLTIYNMLGQEIVKLVDREYQRAGNYSVLWNGKDANGMNVTSGMYIYALKFGNFEKSKQMMLLK